MSNNVDYTPQIKDWFKSVVKKDWMDDNDWDEMEQEIFKTLGISYETMSEQIQIGIDNGHSLETQLELLKKLV